MLLDYDLLFTSKLSADSRVVLAIQVGFMPEQLINGVITHHSVSVSPTPGESVITVTGVDVEGTMDRVRKTQQWPVMPSFMIVKTVLMPYVRYGLNPTSPFVMPTTDNQNPLVSCVWQHSETDLQFIRRLAKKNNYVFYTAPSKLLLGSEAYFQPETRFSTPQSALTMDLGSADNVVSLNFHYDTEQPVDVEGAVFVQGTGVTLSVTWKSMLPMPTRLPLVWKQAKALRTTKVRGLTDKTYFEALTKVQQNVRRNLDAVRATGEVDTIRYGKVLQPGKLVGVRGAGLSYDGYYYVTKVSHHIEKGRYVQRFQMRREGHYPLIPWVYP